MPMLRRLICVEGFLNFPASKSAKSIPNQVKSSHESLQHNLRTRVNCGDAFECTRRRILFIFLRDNLASQKC